MTGVGVVGVVDVGVVARGEEMGVVTVEVGVEPSEACLRLLDNCLRSSAISAGGVMW